MSDTKATREDYDKLEKEYKQYIQDQYEAHNQSAKEYYELLEKFTYSEYSAEQTIVQRDAEISDLKIENKVLRLDLENRQSKLREALEREITLKDALVATKRRINPLLVDWDEENSGGGIQSHLRYISDRITEALGETINLGQ